MWQLGSSRDGWGPFCHSACSPATTLLSSSLLPRAGSSFLALACDGGRPPGLTCTRGDGSDASGLSRLYRKHPCSSCRFLWKAHSGCFLQWAECLHPLKIHVFEACILSAVSFGHGGLWEVSRLESGALRSGIRALKGEEETELSLCSPPREIPTRSRTLTNQEEISSSDARSVGTLMSFQPPELCEILSKLPSLCIFVTTA